MKVLILPMRNGNSRKGLSIYVECNVLILPMRNGNKKLLMLLCLSFHRSYPTYEEWKLGCKVNSFLPSPIRSYPTYEEWKP